SLFGGAKTLDDQAGLNKYVAPQKEPVKFEPIPVVQEDKEPVRRESSGFSSRIEVDDSDLPPFLRNNFKK
ncbi:MAG: hypothetical protein RR334_02930, partial [Clostridia bacterium]